MRRATDLAKTVRPSPNPPVGAVVLDAEGRVAGVGFHPFAGGPHGEVVALTEAGEAARGGTAFVTLEPCNHHGRTPPCTEALLRAGVSRVVYAVADPNPHVSGQGRARLEAAGVVVREGFDEESGPEAERLIRPWKTFITRGRSHVTLKVGMSLDARIATRTGHSQWITSPEARTDAHRLRASVDAILVGSETVLTDDPALTVRGVPCERAPIRVIVDGRLRTPTTAQLVTTSREVATWVLSTEAAPREAREALEALGVDVLSTGPGPTVDLQRGLSMLAARGVVSLLCEGGGRLHGALLEGGLCDRVVSYVAPMLLGVGGRPAFGIEGPECLDGAVRLREWTARPVGPDLRIEGEVEDHVYGHHPVGR